MGVRVELSETDKVYKAISRPLIWSISLLLLALGASLSWFAVEQNRIALSNDRQLADAMLGTLSRQAYDFARDYAYWDDAIINIFMERDEDWLKASYFDGIDDIEALDGLFIVTREGVMIEYPLFPISAYETDLRYC